MMAIGIDQVRLGLAQWWSRRGRGIAYWALWFHFVLGAVAIGLDYLDYSADPTTYHQVYRDPALQQAVSRLFGFLDVVAIAGMAAGFRRRRFSRLALGVLAIEAAFGIADREFNIIVTCCG